MKYTLSLLFLLANAPYVSAEINFPILFKDAKSVADYRTGKDVKGRTDATVD